jgi:uncharacterized membrane protein
MKKENKVYQIRFNTNSKSESDRWRLIENGNEIVVSHVIIDGRTYTTKDWMSDINDFKWHISCIGNCNIIDGIAYIKTIKDDNVFLRHILKTISYRFLGTLTTVITAYSLGVSFQLSSLLGVGELVIKPIIYFLHERVWYKFLSIRKKSSLPF